MRATDCESDHVGGAACRCGRSSHHPRGGAQRMAGHARQSGPLCRRGPDWLATGPSISALVSMGTFRRSPTKAGAGHEKLGGGFLNGHRLPEFLKAHSSNGSNLVEAPRAVCDLDVRLSRKQAMHGVGQRSQKKLECVQQRATARSVSDAADACPDSGRDGSRQTTLR